jgi:hypothetical protein
MKPLKDLVLGIGRRTRHTPLLPLVAMLIGVSAAAVGTSAVSAVSIDDGKSATINKEAIFLNTLPDGSVELSNTPQGDQSDQLAIDAPAAASQMSENPYRLRIPYGTTATATAPDAATEDLRSDNEPIAKDTFDSNGVASLSGANSTTNGGGYVGVNSYSSGVAPTTTASNTGSSATTPITAPITVAAPAGSGPGSTTAASTVPDPISWQGSIPASAVKDPYLAAKLPLIGSALLASGNAAIGRRYLMIDRNTYLYLYGSK